MIALKYTFLDLFGGILRFPVWWYTRGLVSAAQAGLRAVQSYAAMLAVGVWVRNVFVPMFGARDWQSRIISFFMRVFQIIARSLIVCLFATIVLIALVLYTVLPVAAFLLFLLHVSAPFDSLMKFSL